MLGLIAALIAGGQFRKLRFGAIVFLLIIATINTLVAYYLDFEGSRMFGDPTQDFASWATLKTFLANLISCAAIFLLSYCAALYFRKARLS